MGLLALCGCFSSAPTKEPAEETVRHTALVRHAEPLEHQQADEPHEKSVEQLHAPAPISREGATSEAKALLQRPHPTAASSDSWDPQHDQQQQPQLQPVYSTPETLLARLRELR